MTRIRLKLGAAGEQAAADFLIKHGYRILQRNYSCKSGEIDIVAEDADFLVFIEVKTRKTGSYGPGQEAVTPKKQLQISKAAQHYLAENNLFDRDARFDVVSVYMGSGPTAEVEIYKDAFELAFGY